MEFVNTAPLDEVPSLIHFYEGKLQAFLGIDVVCLHREDAVAGLGHATEEAPQHVDLLV